MANASGKVATMVDDRTDVESVLLVCKAFLLSADSNVPKATARSDQNFSGIQVQG